ncbi:MAG: glutathione S-transferase family protein [Rhodobacteraceae bacterium]|nr:glutathione S-transferase family protein [Paracoccaceae bacterium]
MSLRLLGYRYSVYTWAVRMALAQTGRKVDFQEINPFDARMQDGLNMQHPFGRVPVFWDGDFRIFETGAILSYLLPAEPDAKRAARARQVGGIADSYGYLPLVRQVFSHGVFRPACHEAVDNRELAAGMAAAPAVLDTLEDIASEGLALSGESIGPADCHLAPMIGYFAQFASGRALLKGRPALSRWFDTVSRTDSFMDTRPDLSELRGGS